MTMKLAEVVVVVVAMLAMQAAAHEQPQGSAGSHGGQYDHHPAGGDSPGGYPPPHHDDGHHYEGHHDDHGKKPDCNHGGSMCGDPKIVGGDGVTFYFHGRKDQDFCLVSDSDLHINAHFIGKRPEGRMRDFTWVQALGFVHGPHSLTIAANKVGKWDSKHY